MNYSLNWIEKLSFLLLIMIVINKSIQLDDNANDEHNSRKILHNLLHGHLEKKEQIKWDLQESFLMKEGKQIECGATLNELVNETISISICSDRIYQFHKDFTVTIYLNSKAKYSNNPERLHLINGYNVELGNIEAKIISTNGYRKRTEFILKYLPSKEPINNRFWMTLIRSSQGYELIGRTMATDFHSWLSIMTKNNIENGTQFQFEYEMNVKRMRTIPISGGTRFYQIIYRIDENDFILFRNELISGHASSGRLCLGKHKNSLRLINGDKCDYSSSSSNDNNGVNSSNNEAEKTGSLVELLKPIQYGFTLFSHLALVSTEKQWVLLVNRQILTHYDHDYVYKVEKLMDFFTCDKQANLAIAETLAAQDHQNLRVRKKRRVIRY